MKEGEPRGDEEPILEGPGESQGRHPFSRERSPIENALLDWRFNDRIVDFLRQLGARGEPTGLPEDKQSLTILELSRTESQALLLAFARTAASLWLRENPGSHAAQRVMKGDFEMTAGDLMQLIQQVVCSEGH